MFTTQKMLRRTFYLWPKNLKKIQALQKKQGGTESRAAREIIGDLTDL